jgi:ADP-ribose pyrophosphatase
VQPSAIGEDNLERILKSENLYEGRIVKLSLFDVELEDGRRSTREIVVHPGSVAVVPLHGDGTVTLVRQYRLAALDYLLEIPAGTLEPGEDPLTCAHRELEEEANLHAGQMRLVTTFFPAPGVITERMHLYLATDLKEAPGQTDEDEQIEPVRMPLDEALDLVRQGTVRDAKTIIGLLWANFLMY